MIEIEYTISTQTEFEQCTLYIYVYMCGDRPMNDSQGKPKGDFTWKPLHR